MKLDVKIKICDEDPVLGPGLVRLLEFIEQKGSMKEACQQMGMSYSKGWKIINRAEALLKEELIVRFHGGTKGGKCGVTPKGLSLIERFNKMQREMQSYGNELFETYFPEYCE